MKTVQINLWNDYRQKPFYEYNETTHLTIETPLGEEDTFSVREELFRKCLEWKKGSWVNRFFSNVGFSRDIRNHIIDIVELDDKSRKKLYSYLKKDFTKFGDFEINMIMES